MDLIFILNEPLNKEISFLDNKKMREKCKDQ